MTLTSGGGQPLATTSRTGPAQGSLPGRMAYVWARAVGTGGLLLAAIAMVAGPNMWNLGRIISAGCALVCLPVAVAVAMPATARASREDHSPWLLPGVLSLAAFIAVAGTWFTAGLLGWLEFADPAPIHGVLRWPAIPLALAAMAATALPFRDAVRVPRSHLPLLFLDLAAQAAMGAGGILLAAAPFELVGADVRAYLVACFVIAAFVHLLVVVADVRGYPAVADAGCSQLPPPVRREDLRWRGGVALGVVSIILALAVPGWTGPIAGGLMGQFSLCVSCRTVARRD